MRITCEAVVVNELQRKNLEQCIKILGRESATSGDTVRVEYEERDSIVFTKNAAKLIELFEHYTWHSIETKR